MIYVGVRTDNPQAELYIITAGEVVQSKKWLAHRALGESIHKELKILLDAIGANWQDIAGVICYDDGQSFTGLRIGATVANALAAGVNCPVVGEHGEGWLQTGVARLQSGIPAGEYIAPHYSAPATITKPRK